MNKFINIKKILEDEGASKTEVASLVFPHVKYPKRAFSRVLTGKAELTASQAATIADFLGMSIEELYEPDKFKCSEKDGKHALVHVFVYGNSFKVELNTQEWKFRLYHEKELIADQNIENTNISLPDFLDKIKRLVYDWIDLM